MADETVLCRRKDNHGITHVIPVAALGYFPDWEPVPDEAAAPAPSVPARAAARPAAGPSAEPAAGGVKTRKTDSKGRE